MSSRLWFLSLIALVVTAEAGSAQAPSPLELVRGIREAGMPDLALEYLKEIENKAMPDNDKKSVALERAKCLLDMAEDEPDEGTRTSMVGEAKERFSDFLIQNPTHPRGAEASIALARLISIDAKTQLNAARRIEVGDDDNLRKRQREESDAARPLFILASKRFGDAATLIKAKLADPGLDAFTKTLLAREAFDAELAAAINQFYMADTFLSTDANATIERDKYLSQARSGFASLASGSSTSRTAWIARAWMAETLMEQSKPNDGEAEFKAILASTAPEAEEGKRLVRFFQIRRAYLAALQDRTPAKLQASERDLRAWLTRYGSATKPTPEAISIRFYLAFALQLQADIATPKPKTGSPTIGTTARRQLEEAEKHYRILSQTDNDYTTRATKNRMRVVRLLLGEAERPVSEYGTFEAAQMAALIQMSKLSDTEKALEAAQSGAEANRRKLEAEIKDRKFRILALLERARELATDKDNPGDVTDNLLRLVYFYQMSNQPFQAAVLGEYVARTVKSTGGKASLAGLLAINGYVVASTQIKPPADPEDQAAVEAARTARRGDRERAATLARYLDEKFPNDTATDAARHRLASLLVEEKQLDKAFEVIVKVRPGYAQAANARLLEGYLASQLIASGGKELPLPPGGKASVFRRATADLDRVVKPVPTAREEEVRGYLTVRARLALLYLSQSRAEDKEAEAAGPGYEKALRIADDMLGIIPSFECLKGKDPGKLSPQGLEMQYLGLDARARAIYLRGKALVDAKDRNWEKAAAAIEPSIQDVEKSGAMFDEKMRQWAGGQGDAPNDTEAAEKAKVAALARGIDQTRREIVMVGFKLRVRQGQTAEASKMLDLLVKAGGSIEENQPTLEFMARDLAAQIPALKKSGQVAEAKAMGDGLAILLKRLGGIPNLTNASILFLGQTLYLVEQYDDALKEFEKIPLPAPPKPPVATPQKPADWWTLNVNKLSWFKITDQSIETLKGDGVPDAVLAKLNPLKNAVLSNDDFEKEVKRLLSADELKQYLNLMLNRSEIDRWYRITDQTIAALQKVPVPEATLAKLNPLKDKPFLRNEFTAEVERLLSKEEKEAFLNAILRNAEVDSRQEKKRFQEQIRDYRPAQLFVARCLRGQNKLPEAEKLLVAAVGTPEKQGYAYGSPDSRKELALVYEAKAVKDDPKAAKEDWGKAYKEWNTLVSFASNDVRKAKDPTPEQEKQLKNHFFEEYYELQRCFTTANAQLLKANPQSLAKTYAEVGKKIFEMEVNYKFAEREKAGMGLIAPEIWSHYCDLLEKFPDLKNAYKAAGGKFFLDRPRVE